MVSNMQVIFLLSILFLLVNKSKCCIFGSMSHSSSKRSLESLRLDGGLLCLDFVNTIHSRTESPAFDYLTDYADLLAWLLKCGAAPKPVINKLTGMYRLGKPQSARFLKRAKQLREELYRIFSALADDCDPVAEDIEKFNSRVNHTWKALQLEGESGGWEWSWIRAQIDLAHPLRLVIKSAAELLLSDEVNRIRECPACGWVFLDRSKNGSRRWCSMDTCGSIDKASRYYYRNKQKNKA